MTGVDHCLPTTSTMFRRHNPDKIFRLAEIFFFAGDFQLHACGHCNFCSTLGSAKSAFWVVNTQHLVDQLMNMWFEKVLILVKNRSVKCRRLGTYRLITSCFNQRLLVDNDGSDRLKPSGELR